MGNHHLVFTVSCDNEFKKDPTSLQSRWKTEKNFREFKQDFINSIQNKDNKRLQHILSRKSFLMKCHSPISYEKIIEMVDLRGIELKNLNLTDFDLSYCCFDFALLNNVVFDKTGLQYSSFNNAQFQKCSLLNVQASPISAFNSSFIESNFENGFFMHSDFRGVKMNKCNIKPFEIPNSESCSF